MQQAILILENKKIFYGKSVGYKKDSFGEIVFNTAMTGYQEVISDPSPLSLLRSASDLAKSKFASLL